MPNRFDLRGPHGEKLTLASEGEVRTLGRRSSCDVVISESSVSRNHASVRYHQGRVEVRDNGSREGSFINGKALGGGQWYPLPPGGVLLLGRYAFLLVKSVQTSEAVEAAGPSLTWNRLEELAARPRLEDKESFLQAMSQAARSMGSTGGVLTLPPMPSLIIPDLHGQRDYLLAVLRHRQDGTSLFELMQAGQINVVCLGDGLHGERRVRERWLQAEKDLLERRPSAAMEQEAVESLGLMKMVLELKCSFPAHFHYLRGNHDEINNPTRKLFKYTRLGESELFRHFLQHRFGKDFVDRWAALEKSMPLLARGTGFVASHAAPGGLLSAAEIETRSAKAFTLLAWTNNYGWPDEGSQHQTLRKNLEILGYPPSSRWIVGHCKVEGENYRSQLGGQLIQINPREPGCYVVALVGDDFRPERDVFRVK